MKTKHIKQNHQKLIDLYAQIVNKIQENKHKLIVPLCRKPRHSSGTWGRAHIASDRIGRQIGPSGKRLETTKRESRLE